MEHTPELLTTDGVMLVGKLKMGMALPMEVPIPRMAQSL
jgi:hypothetical protein